MSVQSQVDGYIRKSAQWQQELIALRQIAQKAGLVETMKWRHPCYTSEGRNIVILGRFKEYCAMTFVKGALLKDPTHLLQPVGVNTQSARVIRFTDVGQIRNAAGAIGRLIKHAVEVERLGLKAPRKAVAQEPVPEEFQRQLDSDPRLRAAFEQLTPGRRRAYLLFFSAAKQSKTREGRVEKCRPQILSGKGLGE